MHSCVFLILNWLIRTMRQPAQPDFHGQCQCRPQTCRVFPKQQMLSGWSLLVCHSTKLKYVGFVTPLIPWQEKLSSAMRSRIKPPSLIFWRLQIFYTLTIKLFLRHFWWASKNLIEWIWNIICVQATTNWKKLLEYNDILSAGGPTKVTSFFSMLIKSWFGILNQRLHTTASEDDFKPKPWSLNFKKFHLYCCRSKKANSACMRGGKAKRKATRVWGGR